MQASGHTYAQAEQPTQASGLAMCEKLYPFEFASNDKANTADGQATTHRLQPLHRSTLTTIAPFTFAIILFKFKIAAQMYLNLLKEGF